MAANIEKFDFDPEKLRQKYREERDKRLRPDGNDQYKEVKGDFSYFVEDPYVEEKIERASLKLHTEIGFIGGGFGGMLAAASIRDAGFVDFKTSAIADSIALKLDAMSRFTGSVLLLNFLTSRLTSDIAFL